MGLPLDLQVYEANSFKMGHQARIAADNAYYQQISAGWGEALKEAFQSLPEFSW